MPAVRRRTKRAIVSGLLLILVFLVGAELVGVGNGGPAVFQPARYACGSPFSKGPGTDGAQAPFDVVQRCTEMLNDRTFLLVSLTIVDFVALLGAAVLVDGYDPKAKPLRNLPTPSNG